MFWPPGLYDSICTSYILESTRHVALISPLSFYSRFSFRHVTLLVFHSSHTPRDRMASLRHIQFPSSTTHIPTTTSTSSLERASSYSTPTDTPGEAHERESEHQVKATLTELLNDARVRSNPHGSRRVQNALMDTERELRKQRRRSSRRSSEVRGNSFVDRTLYGTRDSYE